MYYLGIRIISDAFFVHVKSNSLANKTKTEKITENENKNSAFFMEILLSWHVEQNVLTLADVFHSYHNDSI